MLLIYVRWYVTVLTQTCGSVAPMEKQYSQFYYQCVGKQWLGNSDDCMLVTDNNSNQSLKQNYETVIGVIGLTCPDALFKGICNYLQMIKDDECWRS
jgi:hypothetical protein